MKPLLKEDSHSRIVDSEGRVKFYPIDNFIDEICGSANCFICGKSRAEIRFNKEHVLPDWLLRKHNLHSSKINMVNKKNFTYGKYVVPCCHECNSEMGAKIEKKVRELLESGYDKVAEFVLDNGTTLFHQWLSLIFFKTHYKDFYLKFILEDPKSDAVISDLYEPEELHHIHCIARSWYTNAIIEANVAPTLVFLPCYTASNSMDFDYADMYLHKSILIRTGDIAIIAILDDSGAALVSYKDQLDKISAPLAPIQLRELFSRISYRRYLLKNPPKYGSDINLLHGEYRITAHIPDVFEFKKGIPEEFGRLMYNNTLPGFQFLEESEKIQAERYVPKGKWTWLFRDDGSFNRVTPPK